MAPPEALAKGAHRVSSNSSVHLCWFNPLTVAALVLALQRLVIQIEVSQFSQSEMDVDGTDDIEALLASMQADPNCPTIRIVTIRGNRGTSSHDDAGVEEKNDSGIRYIFLVTHWPIFDWDSCINLWR